ncbi:MAG: hypothetical protein ACRDI1_03130, partial [Actinomycetota bacterium]
MSWFRKKSNATKGTRDSRIGARPELEDPPRASRLLRDLEEGGSEADARRERLRAALPDIDEKYVHTDVTRLGERVGPGGQQFMDATEEYKRGNWESACRLMNEAVSLELTMPFESAAHRALGVLYIKLGDLHRSVEHFLKCLEVPVRDEGALRD